MASAAEFEKDSPGLIETIERSAQMAASASGSRGGSGGASTSHVPHQGGASTSHAGSSSTLVLLDHSFDWSGASE